LLNVFSTKDLADNLPAGVSQAKIICFVSP
jgi:hypothetical protein